MDFLTSVFNFFAENDGDLVSTVWNVVLPKVLAIICGITTAVALCFFVIDWFKWAHASDSVMKSGYMKKIWGWGIFMVIAASMTLVTGLTAAGIWNIFGAK